MYLNSFLAIQRVFVWILILLEGSAIVFRHYLDRQNVSMKTSDNF